MALATRAWSRRSWPAPWMAGFTCYLWNIDRTLWVADRIKQTRPEVLVAVGGPEITSDNDWVLEHPAVNYAVIGEGEQTFAELLRRARKPADRRKGKRLSWKCVGCRSPRAMRRGTTP